MDTNPTNNKPSGSNPRQGASRPSGGGGRQNKPQNGSQGGGNGRTQNIKGRSLVTATGRNVSRGAAIRAQKRSMDDAMKVANQYLDAASRPVERGRANVVDDSPRLKIIGLGGMDGGGSKNMMVIEYKNDAIVIDCCFYSWRRRSRW